MPSVTRQLIWVWQIEEAPGPLDSTGAVWNEPPPLALNSLAEYSRPFKIGTHQPSYPLSIHWLLSTLLLRCSVPLFEQTAHAHTSTSAWLSLLPIPTSFPLPIETWIAILHGPDQITNDLLNSLKKPGLLYCYYAFYNLPHIHRIACPPQVMYKIWRQEPNYIYCSFLHVNIGFSKFKSPFP